MLIWDRRLSRSYGTADRAHMGPPRVPPISPISTSDILVHGKTFVSYEGKVTFHTIFVRRQISLVNLWKCFLANRDNFFPHEQPLIKIESMQLLLYCNMQYRMINTAWLIIRQTLFYLQSSQLLVMGLFAFIIPSLDLAREFSKAMNTP